ncbi:Retrovirus-related Pol polyprotein from transposon 297,Retrovirus-related Pol polyprotein from transposon 17.6 [Mytilus coruscus]|uniref:Retrovirus-related Pol polyprotein from transposon 297,Retrovirus-related Pol polyprotein from transposon 17.6 n=1 Tax=Mytilus coruscus TaxID=42192 RepID=A0A6J8CFL3_MYTCO|nr:Retrovirus-related Pol polyprotein from transposon 297,Retrovirus-related Pol polyprotein from transposon 17.6 [Mytilus coruscus]
MNLDNNCPDVSEKHGTFDNNYVSMCQSSLLNNFINVNIGSLSMHAMVDTGADISVANPSILSKLDAVGINVVVKPSDKKVIITANDEHVEIVGTINVDLKGAVIDFNAQKISFDPQHELIAKSDITVPPKSEVVIAAKVKGAQLPENVLGLASESPSLASYGLLAANSIALVNNGTVMHGLCNIFDKSIKIKKNSNVGKFNTQPVGGDNKRDIDLPDVSRDLKVEERGQLNDLLRKCSDVFVNKKGKLGDVIEHEIHIPDKCKPIRQRPYKLGTKQKEVLENVVSDMLKDGIIEPSTSPWTAPCLLVAKKCSNTTNADYRFVVDFRRVNECIELNAHPLLTTEDALESVGAKQPTYFSALDLKSGFYQSSIHPKSTPYTAWRCHFSDGISPDPDRISTIKDYPIPKRLKDVRAFLGLSGFYRKFIKDYAKIASPLYALTKKNVDFTWAEQCDNAFKLLREALILPPLLAYPDFDEPFQFYTGASSFALGAVLCQIQDGIERVICYSERSLSKQEQQYGITEKECLALVYAVKKFDCYLRFTKCTANVDHSALKWLLTLKEPTRKFARWIALLQSYNMEILYRPGTTHGNADGVSRREYENVTDQGMESFIDILPYGAVIDKTGNNVKIIKKHSSFVRKITDNGNIEFDNTTKESVNMFPMAQLKVEQRKDTYFKNIITFLESGELPENAMWRRNILTLQPFYFINDGILYHINKKYKSHCKETEVTILIAVPRKLVPVVLKETQKSCWTIIRSFKNKQNNTKNSAIVFLVFNWI